MKMRIGKHQKVIKNFTENQISQRNTSLHRVLTNLSVISFFFKRSYIIYHFHVYRWKTRDQNGMMKCYQKKEAKTLYLRSVLEEMQKEEEGTKWKQEEKWPEERPSSSFCVSRDHLLSFCTAMEPSSSSSPSPSTSVYISISHLFLFYLSACHFSLSSLQTNDFHAF